MSILGNVEFGSANLHGNLSSEATFIILTNNSNRAALAQINITEPVNTLAPATEPSASEMSVI